MTGEVFWAGIVVSAAVAFYFAWRSNRVHRSTISALQAGIATIRDTRIAIENRPFRVERQHRFISECGIEGDILFEKYGVQAAHISLPSGGRFPVHLHERTGEIYCITKGSCDLRIYSGDNKCLCILDRNLDAGSDLVRSRVGFVDPGAWHEIVAGRHGCEMVHFSVPPHEFDEEES